MIRICLLTLSMTLLVGQSALAQDRVWKREAFARFVDGSSFRYHSSGLRAGEDVLGEVFILNRTVRAMLLLQAEGGPRVVEFLDMYRGDDSYWMRRIKRDCDRDLPGVTGQPYHDCILKMAAARSPIHFTLTLYANGAHDSVLPSFYNSASRARRPLATLDAQSYNGVTAIPGIDVTIAACFTHQGHVAAFQAGNRGLEVPCNRPGITAASYKFSLPLMFFIRDFAHLRDGQPRYDAVGLQFGDPGAEGADLAYVHVETLLDGIFAELRKK